MAKRCQLSTGKNSKCFDFTLNDDEFRKHTRGFVLATTDAATQKCITLFDALEETSNTMS